jgi:hypothetical protein
MTQEFNNWWNENDLTTGNPFGKYTPVFWAWEGWVASARAFPPQPPREWVGLTESKIDNLLLEHGLMEQWPTQKQIHAFVKAIDQALKEKNT